jgi:hypothetical protein
MKDRFYVEDEMKITSVNLGEIFAWLVAIVLFVGKAIDFQTFILFILLKLTCEIKFK